MNSNTVTWTKVSVKRWLSSMTYVIELMFHKKLDSKSFLQCSKIWFWFTSTTWMLLIYVTMISTKSLNIYETSLKILTFKEKIWMNETRLFFSASSLKTQINQWVNVFNCSSYNYNSCNMIFKKLCTMISFFITSWLLVVKKFQLVDTWWRTHSQK